MFMILVMGLYRRKVWNWPKYQVTTLPCPVDGPQHSSAYGRQKPKDNTGMAMHRRLKRCRICSHLHLSTSAKKASVHNSEQLKLALGAAKTYWKNCALVLALRTGLAKPVQKSGQLLAVLVGVLPRHLEGPKPPAQPLPAPGGARLSQVHQHCIVGMLTSTLVSLRHNRCYWGAQSEGLIYSSF